MSKAKEEYYTVTQTCAGNCEKYNQATEAYIKELENQKIKQDVLVEIAVKNLVCLYEENKDYEIQLVVELLTGRSIDEVLKNES